MNPPEFAAPKVFISYSHDSLEHANRVLALSDCLRKDGIDCTIDQYESWPSEGWPRWTQLRISEADYVLLVCTPSFQKHVEGKEKMDGDPDGVWSGYLVYQAVYDGTQNAKYLPLLFEGYNEADIPAPLQGGTCYQSETPQGYENLYRCLTNQTSSLNTPVRKLPGLKPRACKPDLLARIFNRPDEHIAVSNVTEQTAKVEEPQIARSLEKDAELTEYPDLAVSLTNQANLYYEQGRFIQAEPLSKRALAIREKALGPDHPEVAASLMLYAKILREKKFNYKAAQLEARAKTILRQAKKNAQ